MTSSSASPPGFDADPPRGTPNDRHGTAHATAAPPASAVTLADLIADAGPLPADAALECIQRLAEVVAREGWRGRCVDASNVLLDDDGGIWLLEAASHKVDAPGRSESDQNAAALENIDGMNRIGHLLMFLVTGNDNRFETGPHTDSAAAFLPAPVATVARRLFSRNGHCYPSCDELARDAATMRGDQAAATSSLDEPVTREGEPAGAYEPIGDTVDDESTHEVPDAADIDHEQSATGDSSSAMPVMIVLVLLAIVVGLVIWLSL